MRQIKQWSAFTVMVMALLSCTVSPTEYTSYFTKEEHGFRKEMIGEEVDITIQYLTPELKTLNEIELSNKALFSERVKELEQFEMFELNVNSTNPSIKTFLKAGLEQSISLNNGIESKQPIFYHFEQNPMANSYKVQVYFLASKSNEKRSFSIAHNHWMQKQSVDFDLNLIKESPQLIL